MQAQQRQYGGELEQREGGSGRQIQEIGGLPVDLHLQGGERRPSQDLHHTEGGEGEEEDHQCGGRDGRPQRGQRDPPPGAPTGRSEHPGRLLLPRVELPPEAGHRPYDHGVVEEDVRQQDRPHRRVQPYAPQVVQHPAAPDQGQERRPHHHRGQDERHRDHGPQQLLSGEFEAREDIRAGEREQQREPGRGRRLPDGEPQDVQDVRVGEHLPGPAQLPLPAVLQPAPDDRGDRVGEEQREEGERQRHQGQPGGRPPGVARPLRAAGHFRTSEDHCLIHCSRFLVIASGASVSGLSIF